MRSLVGDHPKQWNQVLFEAKFSYNDSPNIVTSWIPLNIMNGMHLRGVHDLRRVERRSATREDIVIAIQEIHEKVNNDYKKEISNISLEQVSRGKNRSSKWRLSIGTFEGRNIS